MNDMSKSRMIAEKLQSSLPEAEYLTFYLDSQMFGVSVLAVQDVLNARHLAKIPLAPEEVAGALNLRGRIITAIHMRRRMRLADTAETDRHMSVVVDFEDELYSLIVDSVGDVLRLTDATFEANPATLNPHWKEMSAGVHRLEGKLMIVLDVERILAFAS